LVELKNHVNIGLIIVGMLFFSIHIIARYYVNLILMPQGMVTLSVVALRDNILQIGIIISSAALIIPSAGFPKDEEKIITYIYPIITLTYLLGLFLHASNSALATYISIIIFLGFLGLRGKRLQANETERIATTVLSLMLILNLVLTIWIFSLTSGGITSSMNLTTLGTHSMRYAVWLVVAAFIMKFSNQNAKIYRSIILVISGATIIWTLAYAGDIIGIPTIVVSGLMDGIIGISFLISALTIWGVFGKRGNITPHFGVGSIAFIWLLISGAVGLYLIIFYSWPGVPVIFDWRLFHLINSNWSLAVGIAAIGLASARSLGKLSWTPLILFSAAMIKSITFYMVYIDDQATGQQLIRLGEPFLMIGFIVIAIFLFRTES
jgi:hypothetical protein